MSGRTSLKKRILSSRAVGLIGTFILSLVLRLIQLSARIAHQYPTVSMPYVTGEKPAIFCFWHGRMMMNPFVIPQSRTMYVLISSHNDGQLITTTMRRFGIQSVRISRKSRSPQALRDLFAVTQRGDNIAITPDGPRGPFQQAAEGAAYVSLKTGYPIVPVTFSATRHWRFRSWDKFMVPKFFTRILYIVSEPILVRDVDGDTDAILAQTTAQLAATLNQITAAADRACGVVPQ